MSEHPVNSAAQFRADLPEGVEQESVRTTIVGGRPPGRKSNPENILRP